MQYSAGSVLDEGFATDYRRFLISLFKWTRCRHSYNSMPAVVMTAGRCRPRPVAHRATWSSSVSYHLRHVTHFAPKSYVLERNGGMRWKWERLNWEAPASSLINSQPPSDPYSYTPWGDLRIAKFFLSFCFFEGATNDFFNGY